jgi:hypothetical protein
MPHYCNHSKKLIKLSQEIEILSQEIYQKKKTFDNFWNRWKGA